MLFFVWEKNKRMYDNKEFLIMNIFGILYRFIWFWYYLIRWLFFRFEIVVKYIESEKGVFRNCIFVLLCCKWVYNSFYVV